MEVEVLLFAALRDALGGERIVLSLPEGATGADLRRVLQERHPAWRALLGASRLAQGSEFLDENAPLAGREPVAVLPPVSGGAPRAVLTREPLDPGRLEAETGTAETGARCVFVGTVRSPDRGRRVHHIDYEAHEPMALARMEALVEEAERRWPGVRAVLHHRLGRLLPGEASVVAVAAAPHRAEAFEAVRFLVEALKRDVPIWKREAAEDGERWVGAPGPESPGKS